MGAATLTLVQRGGSEALVIHGIGDRRADGVHISAEGRCMVQWEVVLVADPENPSMAELEMTPVVLAGDVSLEIRSIIRGRSEDRIEFVTDFTSMGSRNAKYTVYRDGALVSTSSGDGSSVTVAPLAPKNEPGARQKGSSLFPEKIYLAAKHLTGNLAFAYSWGSPVSIALPTGQKLTGDVLEIGPEQPSVDAYAFEAISVRGRHFNSLTFSDESALR